jgi:hypothetical protein
VAIHEEVMDPVAAIHEMVKSLINEPHDDVQLLLFKENQNEKEKKGNIYTYI